MTEVRGTIQSVEAENNNGREKKVVTLAMGRSDKIFIEFQGRAGELVSSSMIDKNVSVRIVFNGKVSKLGRRYNNILGKSIKTL